MKLQDIANELHTAAMSNGCDFHLSVNLNNSRPMVNFWMRDLGNYDFYDWDAANHSMLLNAALKCIAAQAKQAA